jgi:N-acetylneuraminate synthase
MPRSVVLGRRTMSPTSRPYIIAEIGVNHEGSLELAKRLIELAKEGGADGAKFQSYKADTLASKNSPAYWDTSKEATRSQHELFQKYDNFEPEDYAELARHAAECDIDFLSTPFDDAAVDYLEPLVPFYKIASADITNTPLLRRVARTRKPVVLSTGASNMDEIRWSVQTLHEAGATDVVLLHCILNYPCENRNAHVRMITGLAEAFPGYLIGYSDHTVPDPDMTALAVAYSLGAVVLEKHFTHDKTLPGNDHYHAMDMHDLRRFVDRMATIADILGEESAKAPIATEDISRLNARRSIVLARSVRSGQVLAESDLTYKRPGTGVGPQEWDRVIGMSVTRDLPDDHVLTWDDLRAT